MPSDSRPDLPGFVPLSVEGASAADPDGASGDGSPPGTTGPPEASGGPGEGAPSEGDLLRRLLLGDDHDAALDRVVRNDLPPPRVDASDVARVLPEAVLRREAEDHDLGDALVGPVERGLKASVERNPQPIVDAIFPVIGPAIRRAIRHAMAQSLESVNQSVNYGLSWQGVKWRMEARRSGLSFGEVVLRHTLQYRVEEVLLVHRETGLLLKHVVAQDVPGAGEDGDLVSAMLTAVRQFVGDSFSVDEDDALDAIEVGDLNVWIEPGPRAIVAAVIRGHPPEAYRDRLTSACEKIHSRLGDALTTFTGETAPFDAAGSVLEGLLDAEYVEPEREGLSPKLIVLLLLIAGLAIWGAYRWWETGRRESAYIEVLGDTPGLDVLRTDREGGRFVVIGARDPLAPDPATFLAQAGLEAEDVDARWVTAFSTDTTVVARRAAEAFGVPAGVTLTASPDGTIRASGARGDTSWVARARDVLPLVPGANRLDLRGLMDDIDAARAAVEAFTLQFAENGAAPTPEDLAETEARVARLNAASGERNQRLTLEITGHTDDLGTPESNEALGLARARAVAATLESRTENLNVRTLSRGALDAFASGAHPPSRRATFRVLQ